MKNEKCAKLKNEKWTTLKGSRIREYQYRSQLSPPFGYSFTERRETIRRGRSRLQQALP
jgi:hypothetical protein